MWCGSFFLWRFELCVGHFVLCCFELYASGTLSQLSVCLDVAGDIVQLFSPLFGLQNPDQKQSKDPTDEPASTVTLGHQSGQAVEV